MREKLKRKSSGRFCDRVDLIVKRIELRHCLGRCRSLKLLGAAISDDRVLCAIMDYVNRVVTGRGDGLTLVDLCENKEFKRLEKLTMPNCGVAGAKAKKSTKKRFGSPLDDIPSVVPTVFDVTLIKENLL